jgi:hypothetical protein
VYGLAVIRRTLFMAALLAGLLGLAGTGLAQQPRHGAEGRYAAPGGGRWAGPYGYAYPAGVYPGYRAAPAYPAGAYPPPPYGPPPPRTSNSLGSDWRLQQEEARAGVRHGQFAPLGRVIEGLQKRVPGRQLDAGIEYDGGRAIYRVRWITIHGRRVDFLVDAATGAILGER